MIMELDDVNYIQFLQIMLGKIISLLSYQSSLQLKKQKLEDIINKHIEGNKHLKKMKLERYPVEKIMKITRLSKKKIILEMGMI